MAVLQHPGAIFPALFLDQPDGVSHSWIRRNASFLKVVEHAHHVVAPARGKGEAGHSGIDYLAGPVGTE